MRLAAIRAESLKYTYSTALQRRHGHSLVSILPFMPHVDAFFIFKHLFLHSGVFFLPIYQVMFMCVFLTLLAIGSSIHVGYRRPICPVLPPPRSSYSSAHMPPNRFI